MRALTLVFAGFLASCAAGYQVAEVSDKFTDPKAPAVYATRGNSIDFHDPLGQTKPGELNAFVARHRSTNAVVYAGFFYNRSTSADAAAFSGEPRWLSIRAGDQAVFLADDARIVLKAAGGQIDGRAHRGLGYSVESQYIDSAQFVGTADDLRRIAFAKKLEFQIIGANGALSYPRHNRPFLDSFQRNIQEFYQTQVAPYVASGKSDRK